MYCLKKNEPHPVDSDLTDSGVNILPLSFLQIWLSFGLLPVVPTTELEWVPLELCFGIPLFSSELNQKVCRKIATHGLCRKER